MSFEELAHSTTPDPAERVAPPGLVTASGGSCATEELAPDLAAPRGLAGIPASFAAARRGSSARGWRPGQPGLRCIPTALCASMLCFAQTNVLTYRNDTMRTAQNLSESVLTPATVQAATFGKLFTFPVDGLVDAQPLVVSGLTIANQAHNVVFAATENDSVYAFDANTGATYWRTSVLGTGETASDSRGCGQVVPTIGITSTPVIDLQSGPDGTIYAVAMTKDSSGGYHQRLHALNLATGAEQFGGPVEIRATYPGTGDNSNSGTVVFDPKQYKDRTALLLLNGVIYTSWASHCDIRPYTGWTIGYNENTLAQTGVLNFTPNGRQGAVWGSGGGLASDASGNLFFDIGNGTFDVTQNASGFPVMSDYGNAFVKVGLIAGVLTPLDYWTMDNTTAESNADEDLGSGGVLLIPDLTDTNGNVRHFGTGAGKDSNIYLFDRDNMGKYDSVNNGTLYQELPGALANGAWSSGAWFNGNLYYGGTGDVIRSFRMGANLLLGATPTSTSSVSFPFPGTSPSISADGAANGILWAMENTSPAILHAYDANNLATELYNSNQAAGGRDQFGNGNKDISPTVANGEVFVGTPNSVAVFGLLSPPSVTLSPASVGFPNQTVGSTSAVHAITVTNDGPNALSIASIAVTGANPGDFAQTNNCPLSPATIAVNGFCTIDVTFTPAAANARAAAITITDNGNGSPHSAILSGTGLPVPPNVTLSPSSAGFPNQMVGSTSGAVAIALTNKGPGALSITGIAVTGANPDDFAQTNNCPLSPATVAANGFCTINVTFTPAAANMRSAAITITDNGAGSPQSADLSGTGVASVSKPWPNGYTYRATFTVAASQAPGIQTNFPALISGTFADFATTANGGRINNTCAQTVGNNTTSVPCDLIFTSDAAGATPLNWEFETWVPATGAANIWVNVPNLSTGTIIYAWYGHPSVTALQTVPSTAWSNSFMAVYHLKENPAGPSPQMNDSTANANNATMNGAVLASQQQPGEIDGSLNFGGNTWAGLAKPANFSFDRTDSFSLSGWFKVASNSGGTLLSKFPGPPTPGWLLMQEAGSSAPGFQLILFGGTGGGGLSVETPAVTIGTWHYVVVTYSGTSSAAGIHIYVDGVNQPLTTLNNTLTASILNSSAAAINGRDGPTQMSTDTMDEIRISTKGVVFSPAWVTASFNNQSRPATFFTVATGVTNP